MKCCCQETMGRGELRPEADPRAVASLITSLLEGALVLARLLDDPAHLHRAYAHIEQRIYFYRRGAERAEPRAVRPIRCVRCGAAVRSGCEASL